MKDDFRIFVDAHVFDGPYQGTTTFIKGLYTALAKLHPELEICMGANDIRGLQQEFSGLCNCKFISYAHKTKLRYFWDIPLILRKCKANIAHFQYVCPPVAKSTKYIVTTHDLLFNDFPEDFPMAYRFMRNIAFKKSALNSDILTTDSQYSKNSIVRHYGIENDRVSVIPAAVSDKYFLEYDNEKARRFIFNKYGIKNYILYVSRIEPRKNHNMLLSSYLDLGLWERGISLVFIGRCTINNSKFLRMFKNVTGRTKGFIHHIDQVGENDLLEFHRGAALFVYPSRAEGFGIPPLEAAALGIKTLCSNTTAMAEFGFLNSGLFNPDDGDELKRKILMALDDKLFSKEQLVDISNHIKMNYSWEKSASTFMKLIENVA